MFTCIHVDPRGVHLEIKSLLIHLNSKKQQQQQQQQQKNQIKSSWSHNKKNNRKCTSKVGLGEENHT